MKTITDLNSKWWYRLIKVTYVFIFISIFVIWNYIISIDGVKEVDSRGTLIICTLDNNKTINLEDTGVYFSYNELRNFNYKNFFKNNTSDVQTILGACRKGESFTYEGKTIYSKGIFSTNDVYRIQATNDSKLPNGKNKLDNVPFSEQLYFSNTDFEDYINYNTHLFEIKPKYSYSKFINSFIIGNLLIIFAFILLRILFYYVLLGKIKPTK